MQYIAIRLTFDLKYQEMYFFQLKPDRQQKLLFKYLAIGDCMLCKYNLFLTTFPKNQLCIVFVVEHEIQVILCRFKN